MLAQHTLKISKKGQITLPKSIHEVLGSERIRLIILNGQVHLEPVKSVAGSLKVYAKPEVDKATEAEQAWDAVLEEKYAAP